MRLFLALVAAVVERTVEVPVPCGAFDARNGLPRLVGVLQLAISAGNTTIANVQILPIDTGRNRGGMRIERAGRRQQNGCRATWKGVPCG